MSHKHILNEGIRSKQVRLVDTEAGTTEIVDTSVALEKAINYGLDLVLISENATPPVAKILDYGKFKYEQAKASKERQKINRANVVETKEIQLRPVTDHHDVQIKAKRAKEFIEDGDRVKVVVKFRGRELSHRDMGKQVIDNLLAQIGEHKVDTPISMNGRQMFTIISSGKKQPQ